MTLTFTVDRQSITRTDTQQAVANSVSYLRAQFAFLNDWDTDHILTPLFQNGTRVYTPELLDTGRYLDEDNACIVPQEVLAETGTLYVSIFDETDGVRITTDRAAVPIERSGYTPEAEETLTPTPSVYEQILTDYADYKQTGLKATDTDLTLEAGKLRLTSGGEAVGTGVALPKTVTVNVLDVQANLEITEAGIPTGGNIGLIVPSLTTVGIGVRAGTIDAEGFFHPGELYAQLPEWSGTKSVLLPYAACVNMALSMLYEGDKVVVDEQIVWELIQEDPEGYLYNGVYQTIRNDDGSKTLFLFFGIESENVDILNGFLEVMAEYLKLGKQLCVSFISFGGEENG